jgi:uroporphyrinogen-III decarboxylase
MHRCTEVGIEFARAQLAAGAEMIGIGDAICSQISPRLYRRMVLPHQRRLLDAIKSAGGLIRLHICGDITHLLADLATLPIDILDLDHMVDLHAARQIMGTCCTLAGNLDPVSLVRNASPPAIRTALAACQSAAGMPYCVAAGCELPVDSPLENVAALCEPLPLRPDSAM